MMSLNSITSSKRFAFGMIAPILLGLGILTYIPTLMSFGLSFCEWNLLGTPRFVGLANYQNLFADPLFWKALLNTWQFVLTDLVGELMIGLGLALLMNRVIRGAGLWRFSVFAPYVTPLVSVALVWQWIYDPQSGGLNHLLQALGAIQQSVPWLYQESTALWSLVVLQVWKQAGYSMLLFLAGLQAIPADVLESASLDGASALTRLVKIILPLLAPTTFLVAIMILINGFQTFDAVYLLTQGGPNHSTDLLIYGVYKHAFEYYQIGTASAMAYVLSAIVVSLTLIQWVLRKRWVSVEAES